MDVERALISKVISTGQYDKIISKGVDDEMFSDDECRKMFRFIVDHARKYKSPPSIEAAHESMPDFEFEHVQDSLDYVCDRFMVLIRKRYAQDLLLELGEAIDDPDRAASIEMDFLEAARSLATVVPSEEVSRLSDSDKRRKEYDEQVKEGVKPGIPFGFPKLDEYTGGIQPHEFVTIAAFSGVGKTTMLNVVAFNTYCAAEDYVGMYISLEMEQHALLRRFDAMAAGIDFRKLKHLQLPEEDLERWSETADRIRKKMNKRDVLVLDRIRSCTPDKVFAETVKHKPDIVFIDYLSLMKASGPNRGSSQWQSLTDITQELKQNARILGVPIVAAAQTNRSSAKEGAGLDNIGYSLSVVQDSDIVLALHADEDMKDAKEMEIRISKNREGRLGSFKSVWDHENMIFRQKDLGDMHHPARPSIQKSSTPPPKMTVSSVGGKTRPKKKSEPVKARPTRSS